MGVVVAVAALAVARDAVWAAGWVGGVYKCGGFFRRCLARFLLVDVFRQRFRCFRFFLGFIGGGRAGRVLGLVVGFR